MCVLYYVLLTVNHLTATGENVGFAEVIISYFIWMVRVGTGINVKMCLPLAGLFLKTMAKVNVKISKNRLYIVENGCGNVN